jgi:hypothetical protein
MQRTNIYLEPRQTEALDRLAHAEGVSRAELIRRLLDRALVGSHDLERDLAAIDAAFGALTDAASPGRGPDERSRHLDTVWGRE